ncbi:hypothetical protein Q1M64_04885 (plasmid) [Sinorhizobium meliloti]|nr:hypothetical protein Q1M64_04885 [Sinorhizobium meliloti]
MAAEQPPHLKAIVASGVEDGYEDCFCLGGMLQLQTAAGWSLGAEFASQASGAEDRIRAGGHRMRCNPCKQPASHQTLIFRRGSKASAKG